MQWHVAITCISQFRDPKIFLQNQIQICTWSLDNVILISALFQHWPSSNQSMGCTIVIFALFDILSIKFWMLVWTYQNITFCLLFTYRSHSWNQWKMYQTSAHCCDQRLTGIFISPTCDITYEGLIIQNIEFL